MFILGNFLMAMAQVLDYILNAFMWILFVRVLLSWVNPDPFNPIVQFLYRITEPVLEPIRRRLPMMAVDISPIIASIIVVFLRKFLIRTLIDIAVRLS